VRLEIVCIGTSAGGVEALQKLIAALPPDFAPAILIVQHFPESSTSVMPHILGRANQIPAKHAESGETIRAHQIYIAPPGKHMLVRDGHILLVRGPKENSSRPAIDPLFRCTAWCYGEHCAAVLLSGLLDDGTIGMVRIKRYGGLTIVQDPNEASYPDMVRNAMAQVDVDHVLPLNGIAELLAKLANPAANPSKCYLDPPDKDESEMDSHELKRLEHSTKVSALTCPECHGTLFELDEEGVLHFRCRVGHAYSAEHLLEAQSDVLEAAIWTAMRSLEENNDLLRRMSLRAKKGGRGKSAEFFESKLRENESQINVLREALGVGFASVK